MHIKNSYLYLTSGGYPKDKKTWVFFTSAGEAEIKNANKLITELVPLCNGEKTRKEIIECLKDRFAQTELDDFISNLLELGILSDKFSLYEAWKPYGENPMIFFRDISFKKACGIIKKELPKDNTAKVIEICLPDFHLKNILDNRCSTREFVKGVLKIDDIAGLFWSAYGLQEQREKTWKYGKEKTYTVPSGGGLYPLVLYLIELEEIDNLDCGVYRWNGKTLSFERLRKQEDLNKLKGAITGIDSLEDATGIMVIAADYGRVSEKYANKAYLLVLLEAGHSMQNAYLYCAKKNNIGFVELLGFEHKDLMDALHMDKKLSPVVLGVFGAKKED
ncbi:MAG: SagB family peptide dehydrogenase [Candidatus Pacebacteria bacterium]|nr:SagB family peptide dehydrogenase [Candidatus Paceibacterota bacterium]